MSVRATARRVPWSRTDVRLRAWVDQIWLPFVDDDDSPVAVTMGAAPRWPSSGTGRGRPCTPGWTP